MKLKVHWKWLCWQVLAPLVGPIVISALVIGLWMTGNPDFKPNMKIIADVSPWALAFYTLTLVGSALNELWPKISQHQAIGLGLFIVSLAVTVYASFTVIWRHSGTFVPGESVYYVMLVLLGCAVWLCHQSYSTEH